MVITFEEINKRFNEFIKKIPASDYDISKIRRAYQFAFEKHKGQKRYSGDPYIIHPLEVAKIVFELGLDTDSIVSALLHDIIEDTDTSLEDLRREFGEEVELIVDGLTKIATYVENREEKDIMTLRKILLASARDIRVIIIKLCDRLHNLRTLKKLPRYKQERIAKNTMAIYVPIAQKIGIYSLKWELEDLAFKHYNPEWYQYIRKKIGIKRNEREIIVSKVVKEIKTILLNNGFKDNDLLILGRPKNFYSIYKKIKEKGKKFEEIFDLYAVRIIVKNIPLCYTVLGILHEKCKTIPNRLKDYIANPKYNGYQSIHTTIISESINFPVEIQIRTDEMHKLAEYGVAAHWRYKNLKEDKLFEKKISWLREVLQWEKEHKDNIEFLNLLKFDFFQNEIFVFTPKNDLIFLPEGATVLDFAYAIHTDIGDKAYKGKVNGMITNIDKVLKNGDIVEVITNRNVKPNERWLKFVKTSKARLKIRDALNLKFKGNPKIEYLNKVTFDKLKDKLTRVNEFKKCRKAGCCSIAYGDPVVGIVSKDGELVVHNAKCENAKYSINKKIPLHWIEEKQKEVEIDLIFRDRFGLMVDVLNIFSEYNVNILKLNTKIFKNGDVKVMIKIYYFDEIEEMIEKIKELDSVVSVKIIKKGLFGFLSFM